MQKNKQVIVTLRIILSFLSIWIMVLTPASSFADTGWHFFNFSKNKQHQDTQNLSLQQRGVDIFHDDVLTDQNASLIKLTAKDKHEAAVWGLSKDEERRYIALMQNKTGVYFKNTKLTPVEILGINARTNKERSYYAKLDATQEWQKNAKILAYNAAFHQASKDLQKRHAVPIIKEFDYTKYSPYNYQPVKLKANDKLMLLVRINDSVRPIISSLLTSIQKNKTIQLNIYFIGKNVTNAAIVQWAKSQNIPSDLVRKKEITLNVANHRLIDQMGSKAKTPVLLRIRNNHTQTIDTGRF